MSPGIAVEELHGSRPSIQIRKKRPTKTTATIPDQARIPTERACLARVAPAPCWRVKEGCHGLKSLSDSLRSRDWVIPPRDTDRPAPPSTFAVGGPKMIRCFELRLQACLCSELRLFR